LASVNTKTPTKHKNVQVNGETYTARDGISYLYSVTRSFSSQIVFFVKTQSSIVRLLKYKQKQCDTNFAVWAGKTKVFKLNKLLLMSVRSRKCCR